MDMSNVRFKAAATKLMSMVAALALALCMAPAVPLVAPQEAQAATIQSADYAAALDALADRFANSGSDSSIDNNTWAAAFALQALGKRDRIDGAAISSNKDASASSAWGISGGTLAKYILALGAAGADCSSLYAQMESLVSSEFAQDYWAYSAVCILPVYSAYGRNVLTDNAAYSAGDLALYVAESLATDPYMDNQTRAQGLLALAPYAGMSLSDAKGVGFEDDADLYASFQSNIEALAQAVYAAYDANSAAFTDVIDWNTYEVGPNVDTTAWCAAALCAYGWGSLNPSDTAAYLNSVVTTDGTVEAPGVFNESMSASAVLMGLAAIDALNEEGHAINVYTYVGEEPAVLFADVSESSWYHDVVYQAVAEGLITGFETTPPTFGPNGKITRGQVATILFRASGEAAVSDNPFSDVSEGKYYSDGVKWCASQGIVTGYSSGAFKPNANVSREELAVMIARYSAWQAGKDVGSISGTAAWSKLKGARSVSSWAKGSIAWAVDADIIGSSGDINPKGSATRAEATKMILVGVHVND